MESIYKVKPPRKEMIQLKKEKSEEKKPSNSEDQDSSCEINKKSKEIESDDFGMKGSKNKAPIKRNTPSNNIVRSDETFVESKGDNKLALKKLTNSDPKREIDFLDARKFEGPTVSFVQYKGLDEFCVNFSKKQAPFTENHMTTFGDGAVFRK
uniref:Peptidylprolyl isomerase n=1 Tax=Rhabditophanes sp. KR3021 TaxID=114890 RepID=A0AC35TNS8_9BILA